MSTGNLTNDKGAACPAGGNFLFNSPGGENVFGPEGLSGETREMAASVRAFIEEEVVTKWEELDKMEDGVATTLLRQFGDLGFFTMEIPESLGGMGLPVADMLPMLEQLGRCGGFGVACMVHQGIGSQPIVFVGTDEMCETILPKAMSAESICAYALTEPGFGSDALSGQTTAVLDEAAQEWVLNGSKQWITNASWAEYFCVFAQVEGDKFTAFLVERGTPGFEVLAEEEKMGIKGSSTCALRLKNVRIPTKNRMGDIGRGHKIALNMLNLGRLKLGTTMIGAMKQLIAHTIQYTSERHQFGKPINSFGMIRKKIAEMAAVTFAGEAMAYRTASLIDNHMASHLNDGNGRGQKLVSADEYSIECSACKVYLTEAAALCADHAVQAYGGYGFSEEYPVARFYRDVRVSRIYEGSNEINRLHTVNTLKRRLFAEGSALREAFDSSEPGGEGLAIPLGRAKAIFSQLLRALTENDNPAKTRFEQDVIQGLADSVIQLYAAESAVLRACAVSGPDAPLAGHLAALAVTKALCVVRDNAVAVSGASNIAPASWIPDGETIGEIVHFLGSQYEHERAVAEAILENGSEWPSFE